VPTHSAMRTALRRMRAWLASTKKRLNEAVLEV
jgi:hypothetical protein